MYVHSSSLEQISTTNAFQMFWDRYKMCLSHWNNHYLTSQGSSQKVNQAKVNRKNGLHIIGQFQKITIKWSTHHKTISKQVR